MLPEFREKFSVNYGEALIRRLGHTLDYDKIVQTHKSQRCLTRHAGAAVGFIDRPLPGNVQVQENIEETTDNIEEEENTAVPDNLSDEVEITEEPRPRIEGVLKCGVCGKFVRQSLMPGHRARHRAETETTEAAAATSNVFEVINIFLCNKLLCLSDCKYVLNHILAMKLMNVF